MYPIAWPNCRNSAELQAMRIDTSELEGCSIEYHEPVRLLDEDWIVRSRLVELRLCENARFVAKLIRTPATQDKHPLAWFWALCLRRDDCQGLLARCNIVDTCLILPPKIRAKEMDVIVNQSWDNSFPAQLDDARPGAGHFLVLGGGTDRPNAGTSNGNGFCH